MRRTRLTRVRRNKIRPMHTWRAFGGVHGNGGVISKAGQKALTIYELKRVLLYSDNGAWRGDAAQELAASDDKALAGLVLTDALLSGALDASLSLTCVESLVAIWLFTGNPNKNLIDKLNDTEKN